MRNARLIESQEEGPLWTPVRSEESELRVRRILAARNQRRSKPEQWVGVPVEKDILKKRKNKPEEKKPA